jgi:hypothetical protein
MPVEARVGQRTHGHCGASPLKQVTEAGAPNCVKTVLVLAIWRLGLAFE